MNPLLLVTATVFGLTSSLAEWLTLSATIQPDAPAGARTPLWAARVGVMVNRMIWVHARCVLLSVHHMHELEQLSLHVRGAMVILPTGILARAGHRILLDATSADWVTETDWESYRSAVLDEFDEHESASGPNPAVTVNRLLRPWRETYRSWEDGMELALLPGLHAWYRAGLALDRLVAPYCGCEQANQQYVQPAPGAGVYDRYLSTVGPSCRPLGLSTDRADGVAVAKLDQASALSNPPLIKASSLAAAQRRRPFTPGDRAVHYRRLARRLCARALRASANNGAASPSSGPTQQMTTTSSPPSTTSSSGPAGAQASSGPAGAPSPGVGPAPPERLLTAREVIRLFEVEVPGFWGRCTLNDQIKAVREWSRTGRENGRQAGTYGVILVTAKCPNGKPRFRRSDVVDFIRTCREHGIERFLDPDGYHARRNPREAPKKTIPDSSAP